jgi:DNA-binding CsgD family transcriptional regulator
MFDDVYRANRNAHRTSRLSALLEGLRRVTEPQGFEPVMEGMRETFQFAHVTFLVARVGIPATTFPRFLSTYPQQWIDTYLQWSYLEIDPVIEEARTASLPFDWSCLTDRMTSTRSFFDEARSLGVGRHGLTVPVRASHGERSLLSVTSHLSSREWRHQRAACEDDLVVFARHFHDRFVALSGLRVSNTPRPLSLRERQCLELLSKGFLLKQIAAHLSLSDSAVRQYIRSAKLKLSARTLSQAMARAAILEIIPL